ncbi:MAG: hypothetical protein AAB116_09060 [Candidatus Poribacteria bacterium]
MDHKTLGDIFQEIFNEFSEMKPTNFDELEDKVSRGRKLYAWLKNGFIDL